MERLTQKIISDKDFRRNAYMNFKKQLDEKTSKPIRKRNFDKIESLTAGMMELVDDDFQENITEIEMGKLADRIKEYEAKRNTPKARQFRKIIPILCIVSVMLVLNCVTVAAFNMNIVSAVIEFTQGGFTVDFSKKRDAIKLPTSENDPFGFITECTKYEIYSETPHYIPDEFVLTEITTNVNEDYSNTVSFQFNKDNEIIHIDFIRYWNEVGQIGIPSDKYNISETKVNGYPAIVSKEDNQYTVTYQKDKTVFFMFTDGVPYDECEKIVKSIY